MHRVCEIFRLRKEFGTSHGQTQRRNSQRRGRSTGNCTRFSNTILQNLFTVKAELPQEGILFHTQFPSLGIFVNKKVGN